MDRSEGSRPRGSRQAKPGTCDRICSQHAQSESTSLEYCGGRVVRMGLRFGSGLLPNSGFHWPYQVGIGWLRRKVSLAGTARTIHCLLGVPATSHSCPLCRPSGMPGSRLGIGPVCSTPHGDAVRLDRYGIEEWTWFARPSVTDSITATSDTSQSTRTRGCHCRCTGTRADPFRAVHRSRLGRSPGGGLLRCRQNLTILSGKTAASRRNCPRVCYNRRAKGNAPCHRVAIADYQRALFDRETEWSDVSSCPRMERMKKCSSANSITATVSCECPLPPILRHLLPSP